MEEEEGTITGRQTDKQEHSNLTRPLLRATLYSSPPGNIYANTFIFGFLNVSVQCQANLSFIPAERNANIDANFYCNLSQSIFLFMSSSSTHQDKKYFFLREKLTSIFFRQKIVKDWRYSEQN